MLLKGGCGSGGGTHSPGSVLAAAYAEFQEWRAERAAACEAAARETALEAPLESSASAPAAVVFRPHVVYQCLRVLKEINPHYVHITIDESLEVARAMENFPIA